MGLFDSIKDKLGLDKDEAQPQAEVTPEEQARFDSEQAGNEATAAAAQAELDAKEKADAEARAKAEADEKAKSDSAAAADAKAASDAKAKADADAKAASDAKAKADADAKAASDAKAKAEAEAKAKQQAEAKAAEQRKEQQAPAHAPAAPAVKPKRTYTVKPGDNLSEIGAKFGVDYMDIARANGVKNPDLIYPGQVFTIPE
ncbi:LysM domain-containing protein [Luteococcus sp. H138]|uniref:LysM peptidoglycan-binding domain-containing protein n=1 Tax=unclassified Luteococcus TaxID=2639923 RepID=UPI00313DD9AD